MTVKMLKTGETVKVNPCYGARLIEQGKAVFVPAMPKKTGKKEAAKAGEA